MRIAILFGALALARAGAQVPRPSPSLTEIAKAGVNSCPAHVVTAWARIGAGGRIFCAKDASRPAILLVHGLHQDITTWTAPSAVGYSYDPRTPSAERIEDSHTTPGVGPYKLAVSEWLYGTSKTEWDKASNWFDYLAGLGFTVAAWSQPGLSFTDAMPSAMAAFDSLVAETRERNPAAPPPVALLGHSRGGLVIRKILKDRRTSPEIGRVKWVVTLHTPHRGSELAQWPGRLVAETMDLMDCCAPPTLTAPLKQELRNVVTEAMRPMTKLLVDFESRELTPDGPLLRDLAAGETALPGAKYYTFGGTNPAFFHVYLWTFDAMSSVPQYKNLSQYFVWHAAPIELGPVSPVLDKIRPFVREVKAGYGDGLVTDASARLPWSTHFTDQLNHAQVLWNRPLQTQVARLIDPMLGRALVGPRP